MIFYTQLLRIVFIFFLSISIFADKDSDDNDKKEDGIDAFLEDLIYFPGLFDVYQNDIDGKVYLLIKKEQLNKEYFAIDPGFGTEVEGAQPVATGRSSDMTNVEIGDTIQISSITYNIVSVQPDGTGVTALVLEQQ